MNIECTVLVCVSIALYALVKRKSSVSKQCESWLIETVICCGEEQFVRLALSRRGHRPRARSLQ
jgi:hypothetical protein